MKKLFVIILFLGAACSPATAPTTTPAAAPTLTPAPTIDATPHPQREALETQTEWRCPEGLTGQTLHVANWYDYIAENTVANFEALCGVRVTYTTYESNEQMLQQLRDGAEYDVVVPTGYMVESMIAENLLYAPDRAHLPNFSALDSTLLNPPYDPDNRYSVPYLWGTVGIIYHPARVNGRLDGWEELLNYAGGVSWVADPRVFISVGLLMRGSDPNSTDPNEIAAARDLLLEELGDNHLIGGADTRQQLVNGDVDATVTYSGDIFLVAADCTCDEYVYVVPEEGSIIFVDNLAIPASAPNKRLAEAFIDYLTQPHVAAEIANYIGFASPNEVAINTGLIDPGLLGNEGIYPPESVRENLFFAASNADAQSLYDEAWTAITTQLDGE
jgi:spermidine/putrescine transport system substrate-binding protein